MTHYKVTQGFTNPENDPCTAGPPTFLVRDDAIKEVQRLRAETPGRWFIRRCTCPNGPEKKD